MKKRSLKSVKLTLKKEKISNLNESNLVKGGLITCNVFICGVIGDTIIRVSVAICPEDEPISDNNGCNNSVDAQSCQCGVA